MFMVMVLAVFDVFPLKFIGMMEVDKRVNTQFYYRIIRYLIRIRIGSRICYSLKIGGFCIVLAAFSEHKIVNTVYD